MRRTNQRVMPHPVWIKKGAVSPRNQKNVITAEDRQRFYRNRADKQALSLAELKNEWIKWQEFVELFRK